LSPWSTAAASIATSSSLTPQGSTPSFKITEDTSTNRHEIIQTINTISGVTNTITVFGKAAERAGLFFLLGVGGYGANVVGIYNLSIGTAAIQTSGTNTSVSINNIGNGWYRCSLTSQATASGSIIHRIGLFDPSGVINYTGNGTSGIFLWGAQLEAASTPSTYIPTTTTAVTRTADSAVIDGTGVLTGTYTMVEKPAGCAVVSGSNINLQPGFTAERVMVFPAALDAGQITAIRGAM